MELQAPAPPPSPRVTYRCLSCPNARAPPLWLFRGWLTVKMCAQSGDASQSVSPSTEKVRFGPEPCAVRSKRLRCEHRKLPSRQSELVNVTNTRTLFGSAALG